MTALDPESSEEQSKVFLLWRFGIKEGGEGDEAIRRRGSQGDWRIGENLENVETASIATEDQICLNTFPRTCP